MQDGKRLIFVYCFRILAAVLNFLYMDLQNYLTTQEQESFLLALIAGSDLQLSSTQRVLKKAFGDKALLTAPVLAAILYKASSQVMILDFLPYFFRFTDKAAQLLVVYLSESRLLKRGIDIALGRTPYVRDSDFVSSTNYPLAYALNPEETRQHLARRKEWQILLELGEVEFLQKTAPADIWENLAVLQKA